MGSIILTLKGVAPKSENLPCVIPEICDNPRQFADAAKISYS